MEWVEVRGNSVDVAVEAALSELGLSSRDEANIEVVEEPSRGFLGMGSREALVRVSAKPKSEKRQRRRKRSGGEGRGEGGDQSRDRKPRGGGQSREGGRGENRSGQRSGQSGGKERAQRSSSERGSSERGSSERNVSDRDKDKASSGGRGRRDGRSPRQGQQNSNQQAKERTMEEPTTPEVEIDAEGQAAVVAEFLNGLLDSFGLEGNVTTQVDDDLIMADVAGEQTEALIGPKGSIMQSVGELTRTVVQRKTHRRARLRLDIGGYQERRREALRIYTTRLAEQVLDDGGELMLEPMNPADRKTVHDAVVDIEGVSSFSEGEEPSRSVVIALAPGVEPRSATSEDTSTEVSDEAEESVDDADGSEEAGADTDTDTDTSEEAGDSEDE